MLRVGLVGFGMAGRVFHAPLISSVDGLELAAVVERHTDQAAVRQETVGGLRPGERHPCARRAAGLPRLCVHVPQYPDS